MSSNTNDFLKVFFIILFVWCVITVLGIQGYEKSIKELKQNCKNLYFIII